MPYVAIHTLVFLLKLLSWTLYRTANVIEIMAETKEPKTAMIPYTALKIFIALMVLP